MKTYLLTSIGLMVITFAFLSWSYFREPTVPTVVLPASVPPVASEEVPGETTTPPGTGGPMPTPAPDEMPTGQQKVRMGVGKTASAFGLSVTFNKIVSDSRCPVDAECIWAGIFVADVTLASGGKSETIQIEQNDVREWNGYSVTLASVEPIPKSTEEPKPEDYFLTFVVVK